MSTEKYQRPVANPDDPVVTRPPRSSRGPRPGPHYLGLPGRAAIVQGQVLIVAIIVIVQLFIVTDALFELLSGRSSLLPALFWVSLAGFIIAVIVTLWPRRRIEES